MTATKKLSIWSIPTPGAEMAIVGWAETVEDARRFASDHFGHRRDLRHQDIEIRLGRDGKRIEFAGPCR